MKLKNYKNEVTQVLSLVKKPITYTGNEMNAVHKELTDDMIRFALAFPDTYEVGMSHLGTKILYGLLNDYEDVWCERVYAPWQDMEEVMLENGIPLYALESMDPVKNFDFLGFSLQYEMSFTNLLNMLSLSHVALLSADRLETDPFVIAGGPCAFNPEPLADFVDLFMLGETEESLPELMEVYRKWKAEKGTRDTFLRMAAGVEGVYVPKFYRVDYREDGTIDRFYSVNPEIPDTIKKRFIKDLDHVYYPNNMVVSYVQTVHDRLSYEIFRGCTRGCRFCQAGQIYRPNREKTPETIEKGVQTLLDNTGYDELSLTSLSSGDYSQIEPLITELVDTYQSKQISVSLPSLRIDSLSIDMLEEMQKVHKSGITLAPEAGTQRMRDVINKNVTEQDLITTVTSAFEKGWGRVKLYFMIGLPTETPEDISGIADLGKKVVDAFYSVPKENRNRSIQVVLSTSCFVPKAFTPFQWMGQVSREDFLTKQKQLKAELTDKKIRYNWHDASLSYLEAVFARGDRRLGKVLLRAWELGCRFDSWDDCFSMEKWEQAFADCGVDPDFYAVRERTLDEILPWDFIDIGVDKDFLIMEWQKAKSGMTSVNCMDGCENCGMMNFSKGWKCHG